MFDKLPSGAFGVLEIIILCSVVILALVLLVLIVKVIAKLVRSSVYNIRVSYIKRYSGKIKHIELLNENYINAFYSLLPTYTYNNKTKSKTSFDRTDFWKLFLQYLDENSSYINHKLTLAKHNKEKYYEYLCEYHSIVTNKYYDDNIGDAQRKIINSDKLFRIEADLCRKMKLSPVYSIVIKINSSYRSPKGQNFYSDYMIYKENDILRGLSELEEKERFKHSVQYQRSLMTDSLRYDIMQRDGFKCVLCGATQLDGAKLEVDHILPVSKGGKTEWDNLRTLCDRCNGGKSAKYDPTKMN